jgi:hypothetical protein
MRLTWDQVRHTVAAIDAPLDHLLLLGSVPMLAHGLIDSVGDIDILADVQTWERVAASGSVRVGEAGDRIARLPGGVELFDGWYGQAHASLDARATTVEGMRVASLGDVLEFKERLSRPKDAKHLEILRRVLDA